MARCPECDHFIAVPSKDATGQVKLYCRYHRRWVWVRLEPSERHHAFGTLEERRKSS